MIILYILGTIIWLLCGVISATYMAKKQIEEHGQIDLIDIMTILFVATLGLFGLGCLFVAINPVVYRRKS